MDLSKKSVLARRDYRLWEENDLVDWHDYYVIVNLGIGRIGIPTKTKVMSIAVII